VVVSGSPRLVTVCVYSTCTWMCMLYGRNVSGQSGRGLSCNLGTRCVRSRRSAVSAAAAEMGRATGLAAASRAACSLPMWYPFLAVDQQTRGLIPWLPSYVFMRAREVMALVGVRCGE
jgi:hypothetical protein